MADRESLSRNSELKVGRYLETGEGLYDQPPFIWALFAQNIGGFIRKLNDRLDLEIVLFGVMKLISNGSFDEVQKKFIEYDLRGYSNMPRAVLTESKKLYTFDNLTQLAVNTSYALSDYEHWKRYISEVKSFLLVNGEPRKDARVIKTYAAFAADLSATTTSTVPPMLFGIGDVGPVGFQTDLDDLNDELRGKKGANYTYSLFKSGALE